MNRPLQVGDAVLVRKDSILWDAEVILVSTMGPRPMYRVRFDKWGCGEVRAELRVITKEEKTRHYRSCEDSILGDAEAHGMTWCRIEQVTWWRIH
jgi:hypothetical protein